MTGTDSRARAGGQGAGPAGVVPRARRPGSRSCRRRWPRRSRSRSPSTRVGHPYPFFAPVSAWIALGFTTDRSVRRVAELAVGVAIGVGLGDLLVHLIGNGAWQVAVVLFVAAILARFLDRGGMLTTQAGVQALVIVGLPAVAATRRSARPVDRRRDRRCGRARGRAAHPARPAAAPAGAGARRGARTWPPCSACWPAGCGPGRRTTSRTRWCAGGRRSRPSTSGPRPRPARGELARVSPTIRKYRDGAGGARRQRGAHRPRHAQRPRPGPPVAGRRWTRRATT